MKKYILLLLIIWISNPIFSMEETIVKAPGVKLTSLIEVALKAVAKEAIEQYDTGGYNSLERYISSLPKDLVEQNSELFCKIIHEFHRTDIFVKRFLELGQESPEVALNFLKTICLLGQVDIFLELIYNGELFEKNKNLLIYIIKNIDDREFLTKLEYRLENIVYNAEDYYPPIYRPEEIQAINELLSEIELIYREEVKSIEKLEPLFKSNEEIREKGIKLLENTITPMVLIDDEIYRGIITAEGNLGEIISNATRLFMQEIDKLSFEELIDILKFYLFDYAFEGYQQLTSALKVINTLFNPIRLTSLQDGELKKYINILLILLQEYINNYKLTYYAYKENPNIINYNYKAAIAHLIETIYIQYLTELAQRLIKESMLATKPAIKISKINQIYNYLPAVLSNVFDDIFIDKLLEKGLTFEAEEEKLNYLAKAIDVIFNIVRKVQGHAQLTEKLDSYIDNINNILNDKYKDIDKDKLAKILKNTEAISEFETTEKEPKHERDEAEEPED